MTFFPVEYKMGKVCSSKVTSLQEDEIKNVGPAATITQDALEHTWQRLNTRLVVCRAAEGAHNKNCYL
jgi:hypothetical protein